MNWLTATILAIVEGITEYLPISSTGHLILTAHFFGISEDSYVKSFNVIIQSGAIAAVLVLYWRKFFIFPNGFKQAKVFYTQMAVAFFPAGLVGLILKKKIDLVLGSNQVVAWALLLGGIVLFAMDWFERNRKVCAFIDELSYKQCFFIGLCQCLAFIPGVSRAASAMLGGSLVGLSKTQAAEFSFFLAVPTLLGASVVKGVGIVQTLTADQALYLAYGTLLSFVIAVLAIRTLLSLLTRVGYTGFGIYRVSLGVCVLSLSTM